MNQSSQLAQSLLIPLSLRLADVRDWAGRVPLPPKWTVSSRIYHDRDTPYVELGLAFDSFAEADRWADQYTQYHDAPQKGYGGRQRLGYNLVIHLTDFVIWCSFPPEPPDKPKDRAVDSLITAPEVTAMT